jgi:hypothetical protein
MDYSIADNSKTLMDAKLTTTKYNISHLSGFSFFSIYDISNAAQKISKNYKLQLNKFLSYETSAMNQMKNNSKSYLRRVLNVLDLDSFTTVCFGFLIREKVKIAVIRRMIAANSSIKVLTKPSVIGSML